MAFTDFTGDSNNSSNNNNGGNSGGAGNFFGGSNMPPLVPASNSAQAVDDVSDIMINYNERYKNATPAMFRDNLVALTLSVLISANKPNPLLIGSAGVGKTKIIEEIARLIANDSPLIPSQLKDYTIWELPLSNVVAGAGIVGELENRVTKIVDFATDPKEKAILFIDEIHLLQSRSQSYNKIAQILKPALARGDMHLIGATTSQESRKLDDDPAFARRFSKLVVDELTPEQTIEVVRCAAPSLMKHYQYQVKISDEMFAKVVSIADENSSTSNHRPDNALTLLDRTMGSAIVTFNTQIAKAQKDGNQTLAQQLQSLMPIPINETKLKTMAVRLMTGLSQKKPFDIEEIKSNLNVIKGQDNILNDLLDILNRDNLGVFPRKKPLAWMFAGASGTGKTIATKIISQALTDQDPIMINMGEYSMPHDVAKITGSNPGYVGYESNRELPFDSLESNPYRVILLDEIEKAHQSVHRLLLTALDEGWMRMSSGKVIDFSKTVIIATTNAGKESFSGKQATGFTVASSAPKNLTRAEVTKALDNAFESEFLGRFSQVIAFNPIDRATYREIIESNYDQERERIAHTDPNSVNILPASIPTDELENMIQQTYTPEHGARPAEQAVRAYIENTYLAAQQAATQLQSPIIATTNNATADEENSN